MEKLNELYAHPTAENSILEEGRDSMMVDRIEMGHGIRLYVAGHPYPQKGLPTPAAIYAVNQAKRLIIESVRLLGPFILFIPLRRLIWTYTQLTWALVAPHILKDEFLTPQAQEINRIALRVLHELIPTARSKTKCALVIAHIIEYDAAYRFRFMDLMTETTKEKLSTRPLREIRRLLTLNKQRDYQFVHGKFRLIGTLALIALCHPRIRRAFRAALKDADFDKLQFDADDAYWSQYKLDYDYLGRSSRIVVTRA